VLLCDVPACVRPFITAVPARLPYKPCNDKKKIICNLRKKNCVIYWHMALKQTCNGCSCVFLVSQSLVSQSLNEYAAAHHAMMAMLMLPNTKLM